MEELKTHNVDRTAGTVSDELAFVTSTATLGKAQFLLENLLTRSRMNGCLPRRSSRFSMASRTS